MRSRAVMRPPLLQGQGGQSSDQPCSAATCSCCCRRCGGGRRCGGRACGEGEHVAAGQDAVCRPRLPGNQAAAAALALLSCSPRLQSCRDRPALRAMGSAHVMVRLPPSRAGGNFCQRPQRRGQLGPDCLAGHLLPAGVRGDPRPGTHAPRHPGTHAHVHTGTQAPMHTGTLAVFCPSHKEAQVLQTRTATSRVGEFKHQVLDEVG